MKFDKAEITFPEKYWGTILKMAEDKVRSIERDMPPGMIPRHFQSEIVTTREDLGCGRLRIVLSTSYLLWFVEALVSESLKTFLNTAGMREKEWCCEAVRRLRRAMDPDIVTRIGQLDGARDRLLIDL